MGPTAIDLFCSLIFALSVMKIQVCKVMAYFPGVTRSINVLRGSSKPVFTLMARNALEICNYSITDKAKINEQNKSIAVGPIYIGT